MTIKRVAPGYYTVTINGHNVVIMDGSRDSIDDGCYSLPAGHDWRLVVDGEWWQTFWTLREAKEGIVDAIAEGDL